MRVNRANILRLLALMGCAVAGDASSSGTSASGGVMHKASDRSGACAMAAFWTEALARKVGMPYLGEFENMSSPSTLFETRTHLKGGADRELLKKLGMPPSIQKLPEGTVTVGYWKDFVEQRPKYGPNAKFLIEGAVAFGRPDDAMPQELRKEWRRRASLPRPTLWPADSKLRVAVHVRRGDLLFQREFMLDRLLPNQYFLRLLEIVREEEPEADIVIFGDEAGIGARVGKWSVNAPGYRKNDWKGLERTQFRVDGPLDEAWGHMLKADVFIMSKSAFSYVPAMLSSGVVVYAAGPRIIGYGQPFKQWLRTDAPDKWEDDQTMDDVKASVAKAIGPAVEKEFRNKLRTRIAKLQKKRAAQATTEL